MGATGGWNLSGKEHALELLLRERCPKAHTRRSARKAQVVRLGAIGYCIDAQGQIQLSQYPRELTHAKIADKAVFELIERDSGKARGFRELRLRQASRQARPANGLAELFKDQEAISNINYNLFYSEYEVDFKLRQY